MSLRARYDSLHVPIPTKNFSIDNDGHTAVCEKVDRLFDDVITGYPRSVQGMLREMYYNNLAVEEVPMLMATRQAFAMWSAFEHREIPGGLHVTAVDAGIADAPLTMKFLKLHEIAGHTGQALHRIGLVGFHSFIAECETGAFHTFTDQSVSIVDKLLIDALPYEILRQDLAHAKDPEVARRFGFEFMQNKAMDREDFAQLLHRAPFCPVAAGLTVRDFEDFHSRPDVKSFDKKLTEKEPISWPKVPHNPFSRGAR